MISRDLEQTVNEHLAFQPAVALLGPRQVGKTTLAQSIAKTRPGAVFFDLEKPDDRAAFGFASRLFEQYRSQLVVLDEVQAMPRLFEELRPEIDAYRQPGRFLLLGSASGQLLQQARESLAGRLSSLSLYPITLAEYLQAQQGSADRSRASLFTSQFWLSGGFPQSALAQTPAQGLLWRQQFIQSFVLNDLQQFGVTVPHEAMLRLWSMLAHLHGQVLNASQIGLALGGVSYHTVNRYIDILCDAFMVRRLMPYGTNLGKRLVKSPKLYIRDSGLLHALLKVSDLRALSGHPVAGFSWEGFVIEQALAAVEQVDPLATAYFYRTTAGAEMDLYVESSSGRRLAFEIKLSTQPRLSKGFWSAHQDLQPEHTLVVAATNQGYVIQDDIQVIPPWLVAPKVKQFLT
jgi:predicted AAA+ superfamily ATPase